MAIGNPLSSTTVYLATLLALVIVLIVWQRFRSLHQQLDKLQQSQKVEASGLAHDINNLLSIVTGNLDLLEELVAHDEAALQHTQSARKAADLTSRLLKQQLHPIATPLEDSIRNALKIATHALGSKITISTNLLALPPIFIDPTGLESALLNLFLNARDAMPNHDAALHIATQSIQVDAAHPHVLNNHLQPGSYALISVSDNGQGMSKETLARVFEPFFTTKKCGRGTGLGLAMVCAFARQSKGHVVLDSKLGHGTTVSLYLPVAKEPSHPIPQHKPRKPGRKILLVDDEADLLNIGSAYLNKLGYQTLQARNIAQAVRLLAEHPDIDILLTDILMPGGMNGVDFAQYVQSLHPTITILYTSGLPADALAERRLPIAGHILLNKPYRLSDLGAAIARAIGEEAKPAFAVARSTGLTSAFRPLKLAEGKGL
jgi:nitrogen-specific signal transduction histidine kinase/CheY-like chemotaxis protein